MHLILSRLATSLTAISLALPLTGQAQSTSSPSKVDLSAIQRHIDTRVVPYWVAQKDLLTKIMDSPPTPQYRSLWDELDSIEKHKSPRDALGLAMQAQSPDERNARMIWLRSRIANGNADSRYSYAYAFLLSTTAEAGSTQPMLAQAAAFFFHARIALAIDGARCADQASPAIARRSLEHGAHMAPLLHYIATGPKPDVADALANATALEQMRPARPRQDWLCSLGAATMKKALDNQALVKKEGSTVAIDMTGITPDDVPDDTWLQRKQTILGEQVKAISTYFQ